MKGNTQVPHAPVDGVVPVELVGRTVAVAGEGVGATVTGEGDGEGPGVNKGAHVYQSSAEF